MAHQNNHECIKKKITTIKITGTSTKIKALSFHHHTNQLIIMCLSNKDCDFINRRFKFNATNNTDGLKPTNFGLKRQPDKPSLIVTKNPTIALEFLCFHGQITAKQQQEMTKKISPQTSTSVFNKNKTVDTPSNNDAEGNPDNCCIMM